MPFENQRRLKQMRRECPNVQISLIFSASCITKRAIERLTTFCKNNNITPIDFDSLDISNFSPEEKRLYSIARNEIDKAKNNQGGNLAAASDCIRRIIPIIEKCGTYTDLDVQVKFNKNENMIFDVNTPIVYPYDTKDKHAETYTNDILIVANDPNAPDKIAKEAREMIIKDQKALIERYDNPRDIISAPLSRKSNKIFLNVYYLIYLHMMRAGKSYHQYNVTSFRQILESMSYQDFIDGPFLFNGKIKSYYLSADDMETLAQKWEPIKRNIYNASVTYVTGLLEFFDDFKSQVKLGRTFSLENYYSINKHFTNKNHLNQCVIASASNDTTFTDSSWTKEGEQKQALRNANLAAFAIQKAWKKYKFFKSSSCSSGSTKTDAVKSNNNNSIN